MNVLKCVYRICQTFGVDILKTFRAMGSIPYYLKTLFIYHRLSLNGSFPIKIFYLRPMLEDRIEEAGSAGEYFIQDIWAARKIYNRKPSRHIDIGSRIDGFVSHVLTFMPVEVIDIRPLKSNIPGLTFLQEDATYLSNIVDNSVESLSSLHAIEHFGLGRYGDPINPEACFLAMHTLSRILKPAGRLYFSVPIGFQHLEFNAHRIFAPRTILETFSTLKVLEFAYIDRQGILYENVRMEDWEAQDYACGLFEFTK